MVSLISSASVSGPFKFLSLKKTEIESFFFLNGYTHIEIFVHMLSLMLKKSMSRRQFKLVKRHVIQTRFSKTFFRGFSTIDPQRAIILADMYKKADVNGDGVLSPR